MRPKYSWWATLITILDNLRINSTLRREVIWKRNSQMYLLSYFSAFQTDLPQKYMKSYNLLIWYSNHFFTIIDHHSHSYHFFQTVKAFCRTMANLWTQIRKMAKNAEPSQIHRICLSFTMKANTCTRYYIIQNKSQATKK